MILNTSSILPVVLTPESDKSSHNASPVTQLEPQKSSAGFVTTICSIFAIIFVAVCWVFYAYTHPHTSSGQFLIQYGRPQAWSWRRGEARYTAASIHMWSASYPQTNHTALSVTFHYYFVLSLLQRITRRDVMTQRDCKSTNLSLFTLIDTWHNLCPIFSLNILCNTR